jgi:hypothetical protein
MTSEYQISIPVRTSELQLPGYGLPVQHLPMYRSWEIEKRERFPHAIADLCDSDGITVRERRMLDFINKISDKHEWTRKVFDEQIVAKYRAEACIYSDELEDEILSEAMFDYVGLHFSILVTILNHRNFSASQSFRTKPKYTNKLVWSQFSMRRRP